MARRSRPGRSTAARSSVSARPISAGPGDLAVDQPQQLADIGLRPRDRAILPPAEGSRQRRPGSREILRQAQLAAGEIGIVEPGTAKPRAGEIDEAEIGAAEVVASQIQPAEIDAREIEAAQIPGRIEPGQAQQLGEIARLGGEQPVEHPPGFGIEKRAFGLGTISVPIRRRHWLARRSQAGLDRTARHGRASALGRRHRCPWP
jgi:hypothetical protein